MIAPTNATPKKRSNAKGVSPKAVIPAHPINRGSIANALEFEIITAFRKLEPYYQSEIVLFTQTYAENFPAKKPHLQLVPSNQAMKSGGK